MDQPDFGLGDVGSGHVTQRFAFRREVVLRFFLGDHFFIFAATDPDGLGAGCVNPGRLYENPLLFMKRANALLKDLDSGVHHAWVDSIYP